MRVISSCWLRPCPLYTPPVAPTDWVFRWIIRTAPVFSSWNLEWKVWWTLTLRGRRSRNKVSVGEPAEGSFAHSWNNSFWFLCGIYSGITVGALVDTNGCWVGRNEKHICSFPLPQSSKTSCCLIVNCSCQEELTIFNDGCLGSSNDEGRSEVR